MTTTTTITTRTTSTREEEESLIDANATAHDVVALAHLVSSAVLTTFFKVGEEGSRHHLLLLGDHFFSDLLEKKEALRRGKEERDANGLTPMQVYALLGMNGRETFDAFFEGAFSNQPRSSGGSGDDDDDDDDPKEEKRRLLEIERFQRHLFCIGGDSAEAWLEKNDDVGAENAMLQVHACKINDLEALKRMIRLENKIIRDAGRRADGASTEYERLRRCLNARVLACALQHPNDQSFQLVQFILENYTEYDGSGLDGPLDSYGRNALHLCARYDSPKTMRLVIDYLSSRDVCSHNLECMINSRDTFSQNCDGNRTPLMTACSFSPECALLLIEKYGAITSIRSKCGWTALFYAVEQQFRDFDIDSERDVEKQTRVIQLLMEKRDAYRRKNPTSKTDPGVEENATGKNILHLAAINARSTHTLKILFESKSLVQTFLLKPDAHGKTPLEDAAFRGCVDTCAMLLHAVKEMCEANGTDSGTTVPRERLQSLFHRSHFAGVMSSPNLFRAWPNDFEEHLDLAKKTLDFYEDKLLSLGGTKN